MTRTKHQRRKREDKSSTRLVRQKIDSLRKIACSPMISISNRSTLFEIVNRMNERWKKKKIGINHRRGPPREINPWSFADEFFGTKIYDTRGFYSVDFRYDPARDEFFYIFVLIGNEYTGFLRLFFFFFLIDSSLQKSIDKKGIFDDQLGLIKNKRNQAEKLLANYAGIKIAVWVVIYANCWQTKKLSWP